VLDILILPDGKSIPYEAMYLIPKFLSEGGHLITTRLPVTGYKKDSSGTDKWTNKIKIMSDFCPATWQMRFLPWKSAQRSLKAELKLNTNLMSSVRARLPAIAGHLNASIGLPDKLNMFRNGVVNGKRESRDLDVSGGDNRETAGNILLPVYCLPAQSSPAKSGLPSGEATDFLAYRYHNNYYNGSTLVHLGQVGEALMKGDKAGDVLQGCLKLCEEKYPGEQPPEWYERLIAVQRKVSEYGRGFIDAYYKARDGMAAALYAGNMEAYHDTRAKLNELKNGFETVIREKQALDKLLVAGTDYAGQDQRRKALLAKIAAEEQVCAETTTAMDALLAGVKTPERIKVRHALGGIPAAAGISYFGLYELRTDMFQTMKELGINAWNYNQWFDLLWIWDDPALKPLAEGIKLDIQSNYQFPDPDCRLVLSEQGELDVLTGKVEETPRETRAPEKLEKKIREYVKRGRASPIIRYWGGRERGLEFKYWGEQAREEYVEHLKEKYGEVSRLNERWLTAYTNFNDIRLITHQPKTASEHANWEDWRRFREMQLFKAQETTYKLFKKYAPDVFYSTCLSTGSRSNPLFGVDFYELTKTQDISGIDGTARPVIEEWRYLDLIAENKKVWTIEWGGVFYYPPPDILAGCKWLRKQAWQEVSGGHVGINCWIWRWPGFTANSVDMTGLPTQYGWETKQLLSDFRKIEHILLDGKRVDPEIRILFSNTTRCHDQSWHPRETDFGSVSLHLNAVDNLYDRFVKLQLVPRVLDEGALRDGADLSKCRMLIVPQAQYLSRETQDKLLDYARNGGCLVIEGLSGKYDNYGNSSNNLFKALGVALGMVKTKEVQLMTGVFYGAQDKNYQEQFYAPVAVEGGKTLLRYASEEPAIVSMGLGKGKVIVSGLPFSALEPKGTELIMQELFKEAEYTPKYQCDDENLILREWEYGGDLYLICAYPEGKDLAIRFFLKIRGEWEVGDYMLGIKIPVEQDGVYTKFEGVILSPGGCVYRLKPRIQGKPAAPVLTRAVEDRKDREQPETTEKTNQSDQVKTLPYRGELLMQDDGVVLGGYKFQVAVVNTSEARDAKGRVFLTVWRGDEERMQELKIGADVLFVFRNEALRVQCENHSYVYPEGATVTIDVEELPKVKSECGITNNDAVWEMSNGMMSLKILPEGGRIVELKTWPEGINHLAPGGIKEVDCDYPGTLINQCFAVKGKTATPEGCRLLLEMDKTTADGLKERKEISLKRGMAWVGINLELRNEGDAIWKGWLRSHPELSIGGTANIDDKIYLPEKDGVEVIRCSPGQMQHTFFPTKGWVACCDARERLVYVSKFRLDEVKKVFLYFDHDFYNIELWSALGMQLKKGESLRMSHEVYMVKGLSGVSGCRQGWVANLIIPDEKWTQNKKMKFVLEVGNAYLEKQSAQVRVALMRAGKEVRMYYEGKAEVSYEEGFNKEIEAGFDGLAEGKYEFEARIGIGVAESLNIHKTISLLGKKLERDRAACKAYQERLDACLKNKKITKEQKFNAVHIFEELKAAVERQDDEVIRQKREALESALGGLH